MLKVEKLNFSYDEKNILNSVSFDAFAGDFVAILGANGAGKSTLLKCISGFLKNYEGNISFEGQEVKVLDSKAYAKKRAVLSQEMDMAFDSSVLETVLLGRFPFGNFLHSKQDEFLAKKALFLLQIQDFEKRRFLSLSGGEKRKVLFAKTLCQLFGKDENLSQKMLLLDEPNANLDPCATQTILRFAQKVSKKPALVVAILHDPNLALNYATKTLLLKNGKILAYGNTRDVITVKNLEETYSCPVKMITCDDNSFVHFKA